LLSNVRQFVVNQCSIIHHERIVAMKIIDVAKVHVDVEQSTDSKKVNVSMGQINK